MTGRKREDESDDSKPVSTVVIAGAGLAGCQAATALREHGFNGRIVLVGEEPLPPYDRPPLSKAFLSGRSAANALQLRSPGFFAEQHIELRIGTVVSEIDRTSRTIRIERSREEIKFDRLVLAVGARNRRLLVPGADLDGVLSLRTLADAQRLRDSLNHTDEVVVVGGGFVGLEVAATAAQLGRKATIIEAADRVLGRAVTQETSKYLLNAHRRRGLRIELGVGVDRIEGSCGTVTSIRLSDGRRIATRLVVIGIGAVPNVELATRAGLPADSGIRVDRFLRTDDADIYAIGDCAAAPTKWANGSRVRMESVQSATAMADCVGKALATGEREAYGHSVPWFWSDQGDLKVQIAGLPAMSTSSTICSRKDGSFSLVGFGQDGAVVAVESINRPSDHLAARKLLSTRHAVTRQDLEDLDLDLLALARKIGRIGVCPGSG